MKNKEEITPEMQSEQDAQFAKYQKDLNRRREKFMKDRIHKHLNEQDKILFKFYEELADYFAGGKRVVTLQKRGHLEETAFGIMIYGNEYWMTEKKVEDY